MAMKILQVQAYLARPSETFVRTHADLLPADWVLHGYPPRIEQRLVLDRSSLRGIAALARHWVRGVRPAIGFGRIRSELSEWAATCAHLQAIEDLRRERSGN